MSTRGGPGSTPTSLYPLTGFVPGAPGERPWPGDGTNGGVGKTSAAASPWLEPEPVEATPCETDGAGGWDGARLYCAPILTLKSLPPRSCPYVTCLPPPETTPLSTERLDAGTPSCVDASPSSAWYAAAAAARVCLPPELIDELPAVVPWFGVRSVSFVIARMLLISIESSSAATTSRPVIEPCPSSTLPSLTDAVLSALITTHESIRLESAGPNDVNGCGSAAPEARPPSAAPATEKPTTSAPPPCSNDLRDKSRSGGEAAHTRPPTRS